MNTHKLSICTYTYGDPVVNVTISVPNGLKSQLDGRPEINWSEVARQAWREKLGNLELLDKLTAKSKATDADIEEMSSILKKGIAKRHNSA